MGCGAISYQEAPDKRLIKAFRRRQQYGVISIQDFLKIVVEEGLDPVLIDQFNTCATNNELDELEFIAIILLFAQRQQYEYIKITNDMLVVFRNFLSKYEIEEPVSRESFKAISQIFSQTDIDDNLFQMISNNGVIDVDTLFYALIILGWNGKLPEELNKKKTMRQLIAEFDPAFIQNETLEVKDL